MKEANLVIRTILEILNREYNGQVKIKLGSLIADPQKFRTIFNLLTKNTKQNDMLLELLVEKPEVKCSCGYVGEGITLLGNKNARCPKCNGPAEVTKGLEFQILEPRK